MTKASVSACLHVLDVILVSIHQVHTGHEEDLSSGQQLTESCFSSLDYVFIFQSHFVILCYS